MEMEREAAKERARQLEAELEAQRAFIRLREKEGEEERQKETEDILRRAREEMEAKVRIGLQPHRECYRLTDPPWSSS